MLDRLRLQLLSELRIPSPLGRGVCQTIIIARSDASRHPQHPWYEEWVEAQASLIDLAKKCQQFDSDGITLYRIEVQGLTL
ncbi:hypothetical protein [Microcoleus sp. OTE_8_concoct_300]|uniref:hypothetical protein n=1 Tax=Microcoleus sp. OTE_8_concoct_300 TaxID=2964710 RepID=UPI00403EFB1D